MNVRWMFAVGLALLMALGCSPARRRNDAYQELLDAEKRWLEDQVYDLDYEYGLLKEKYASVERENESLRQSLKGSSNGSPSKSEGPQGGNNSLRPPPDLDDLTPPEIDLGVPSTPTIESPPIAPPDLQPNEPVGPSLDPQNNDPYREGASVEHEELVDPHVMHIHLNPLLTGGSDFDDQPGDEGVSIVVEPRNNANQYVAIAGPISIVLLDPALQGDAARVARWDFTLQETRDLMKRSVFGKGVHLRLPWPSRPPTNSRLHVHVRYTTPDGGKLEADREIFIESAGHVSNRWTPLAPGLIQSANWPAPDTGAPTQPGAATPRMALQTDAPTNIPNSEDVEAVPPPASSEDPNDSHRPVWKPYR
jgi:hypothetical protein